MTIRFVLILALGLFLAMTAGSASSFAEEAASVISVRPVVELDENKTDITLGDLVAGHGMTRTAQEKLKAVRLADAPKPGETRAFSEVALVEAFKPELAAIEKQTGETFELRLPSRVTVTKKRFRLNKAAVEAALNDRLTEICGDCEFELSNLQLPGIASTMSTDSAWQIKLSNELPKGNFSLPIQIQQPSGIERTYWVTGNLTVRRSVPVATRAIQMGDRLQPDDIVMQKKDVTYSNDIPVTQGDLTSSVAARQIGAGQIVWKGAVRRELAVKSGDAVKVQAGTEDWVISLDGIAQTSGYVGDLVRVKIPRTNKMISGLLRAKGVVEVQ